jgi:hypothetical protein
MAKANRDELEKRRLALVSSISKPLGHLQLTK